MTKADKTYIDLLKDILENGTEKESRAGRVKSVFGRQLRFDLKEGFPLLTTKKVFTKGIIHELLWFLKRSYNSHGSMNIEYLVRNGVHIWDDDAYRWFKESVAKEITPRQYLVCLDDDDTSEFIYKNKRPTYEYWIESEARLNDKEWLKNITKEEFLDLVLQKVEIRGSFMSRYRFGDLGPIYGKQWRCFGEANEFGVDQIDAIIHKLNTNPNDRRMICLAYNPNAEYEVALPPCHVMMQFYTRELTKRERVKLLNEKYTKNELPQEYKDWVIKRSKEVDINQDIEIDDEKFELAKVPKYGLSCMFYMRSNDYMCGTPFNWAQYALLTHMIAKLVNMIPDELIYNVGDCHVYLNQMNGIKEQLSRKGSDVVPKLVIHGYHESIEDFEYEDFEIIDYHPDPIIKFPLNVG